MHAVRTKAAAQTLIGHGTYALALHSMMIRLGSSTFAVISSELFCTRRNLANVVGDAPQLTSPVQG